VREKQLIEKNPGPAAWAGAANILAMNYAPVVGAKTYLSLDIPEARALPRLIL
jgi:hypothetical protein